MKANFAIAAILTVISTTALGREASCLGSVDMAKLRSTVAEYSGSYGDLPDRINCNKPSPIENRICQSDTLRFMEKLDHMATAYAYENATKQELDHRKATGVAWLINNLKKCKTAECICSAYKKNADDSLGGASPY